MKKRVFLTICACTMLLILVGCGKKDNSVSANLINDNPGEISTDLMDIVNTGLAEDENYVADEEDTAFMFYEGNNTDSSVSEDGAVSDNEAVSENLPLEEYTGEEVEENVETESIEENDIPPLYTEVTNDKINFINICGRNIDKLYISFNAGSMVNIEVLGFEKLKDGDVFIYTVSDMETLINARSLTLSISASSGRKEMDFGTIDIIDPTHINVVLACNKDGYYMYLE